MTHNETQSHNNFFIHRFSSLEFALSFFQNYLPFVRPALLNPKSCDPAEVMCDSTVAILDRANCVLH